MAESPRKESFVAFRASQDVELRGTLLRFNRFAVAFELCGPAVVLRLSEALRCFRIVVGGQALYSGRAVVLNLIETGGTLLCETDLDETAWQDLALEAAAIRDGRLGGQFSDFLAEWQGAYRVQPEYKVIVADMQTFFEGLRVWMHQVELALQTLPDSERDRLEPETAEAVAANVVPCVNDLFEKFEEFTGSLQPEALAAHWSYMRRRLHPLVLCSPFACRTYTKPLGYAGDYEMVNMILRDGWEGDSLYARIVNTWFLRQPPAVAHRNRISYLADRLAEETLRVQRAGRKARVFNLACGPAHETQRFIRDSVVSNFTDFTMLDFNLETLQHLEAALTAAQAQSGRRTSVAYVQKSVHQLFKEAGRGQRLSNAPRYDFVYCAGLFDYLTDEVCRRLMEIMYDWVSPGGLVVATNVDPSNPLRNGMEHLLDWHLSYRSSAEFSRLVPRQADPDDARVITEATGTNLFLEVRKPLHG